MGSDRSALLIVEDDPRLGPIMVEVLGLDWDVTWVSDLAGARALLVNGLFAAAVIDRRLPDGDGTALVAWMRRRADATPVLLLTALGATADKVEGLDAGANDYLVKPFEFDELNARIRALTRDYTAPRDAVSVGSWTFFPGLGVVESPYAGRIQLTGKEAALLAVLAAAPDASFTRAQLLAAVFDPGDRVGVVDTYVHYVRRKTERDLIATVHGVGYRLGTPV